MNGVADGLLEALRSRGSSPDLAVVLHDEWWAAAKTLPGCQTFQLPTADANHDFMTCQLGACTFLLWPAASVGAFSHAMARARAAAEWGVGRVVLTGRGRWLREPDSAPNLVRVTDHINCTGHNPLIELSNANGPVFLDIAGAYRANVGSLKGTLDTNPGITIADGVYLAVSSTASNGVVETAGRAFADVVGSGLISDLFAAAAAGVPWVAYAALEAYDCGGDTREVSLHDFLAICKLLHS